MKLIELIGSIRTQRSIVAVAMCTLNDLQEIKNLVDHSSNEWPEEHKPEIEETIDIVNFKKPSKEFLMSPWGFVEMFYPDYHNCNDIARNDDLTKIWQDEMGAGSTALDIFVNEFQENRKQVKIALDQSDAAIYRKAIEGFINSMK